MKNAHTVPWLSLALLNAACGGGQSFDDGRDGVERGPSPAGERDAGASEPSGGPSEGDAGPGQSGDPSDDDVSPGGSNADDEDDGGASPGASESPSGSNETPSAGEPSGVSPSNPDAPRFDCSEVSSQQFNPATMQAYRVPAEIVEAVDGVLESMSPAEKATQMMGIDGSQKNYRDLERSPDLAVAGVGVVRGFRYREAGHGVNLEGGQDNRVDDGNNFSTVFPTTSVRAASWDLDLERRIGAAMGDETAASLNNVLIAPSADLVRHPYWGRSQEAYGEDSYLVGRMATAFTTGAQEYVMACAKNFAAYNIEKGRSNQNAVLTEQTLREIYARQFEMVVQDGAVGCVVAAYNMVNGQKPTQNEHLLRDILKAPIEENGIGFEGIVITEVWAMPGDQNVPDSATAQGVANEAVLAGTDVERPWALHYTEATLANADQTLVEDAARRVLTQKYRFGSALDTDPWSLKPPTSTLTGGSITPNEDHEALAEEAALKSAVLLVNGLDPSAPVLPLSSATTIAVVGVDQPFTQVSSSVPKSCALPDGVTRECTFHFATDPALGDRGSTLVNGDPARSFGPFQGIQEVAGSERTVTSGNSAEAAATSDAIVVVVGYTPGDEGEEYYIAAGGDRASLSLPPGQEEFVASVLDLNKPTVIIIESGSIVNLPWLSHANKNQATVWAGYPGLRGGLALGKLILGEANFSGKMPMTWATEADLLPFKDTESVTTLGYFFGYREFDRRQYVDGAAVNPVFPFGHGLSYSSFDYSNLVVPCESVTEEAVFEVSVDITNTSAIDGEEVAMLFVKPPPKPDGISGERPWKELRSFARISVAAGQTVTASLPLRVRDLRRWEGEEDGEWVIDSGDYTILVGKNAADAEAANLQGVLSISGN